MTERRSARRLVDTEAYLRMVARLVRGAGRRVQDADVEDLAALIELRDELERAIVNAVAGLRRTGATWEDIGAATGTTRQAAIMKWSRKVARLTSL